MNDEHTDVDLAYDMYGNELRVGDTITDTISDDTEETSVITRISFRENDGRQMCVWGIWGVDNRQTLTWIYAENARLAQRREAVALSKILKSDKGRNIFGPACDCENSGCDHEFKLANARIAGLEREVLTHRNETAKYRKLLADLRKAHEKAIKIVANQADAVALELKELRSLYSGDFA